LCSVKYQMQMISSQSMKFLFTFKRW